MSKGKLIVLEGLDGSGKGTQAKLLAKHLTVTDHLVREITFPDYDSDSSALVKMYLAGQLGVVVHYCVRRGIPVGNCASTAQKRRGNRCAGY